MLRNIAEFIRKIMYFSNGFKIIWWIVLTIILTWVGAWRFGVGAFNSFDIIIFIFWFILVLFPIVSEVSIFGVNVKKEIETAKNEIKSHIATIKTEIQSNLDFRQTFNFNPIPVPAKTEEYKAKIKDEAREDIGDDRAKGEKTAFLISESPHEKRTSDNKKALERIYKIMAIEKLISDQLQILYGEKYKPQMKLEDENRKEKIITDALILRDDNKGIKEIVEIKFITSRSFESFYYVANRFIARIMKLGISIPVRFIVASEQMNIEGANILKNQLNKLNNNRIINSRLPIVSGTFFKFEGKQLIEIKANSNL